MHGAASSACVNSPGSQTAAVHCRELPLPAGESGEDDGQGRQAEVLPLLPAAG